MITQRDHTVNATLLLASASPRRRELIKLLGLPVETTSADIDETPLDHEQADELARRLSREKAHAVHSVASRSSSVIIASDTTVSLDGESLGKPIDVGALTRSSSSSAYRRHLDRFRARSSTRRSRDHRSRDE